MRVQGTPGRWSLHKPVDNPPQRGIVFILRQVGPARRWIDRAAADHQSMLTKVDRAIFQRHRACLCCTRAAGYQLCSRNVSATICGSFRRPDRLRLAQASAPRSKGSSPRLWNTWTSLMERLRISRTRDKVRLELIGISSSWTSWPEGSGRGENGLTNMSRTIYCRIGGEA
jgi:hypothetical protein